MTREVEERIVAMYFDNEDFEKNAKTTIDTLGQLKKGLDLEESAKGFGVFEKLGKTLNFDKANQGLKKMKSTMSGMSGTFKKIFSIGQEPFREAESFLHKINGYITKVAGIDFASKVVHGIENTFRNLAIAPVSAGWGQYESTMDSIKTIMSSTGESLSVVEQHLASMTEYANKTVYSLTDMTSNLGKFTNNGVDLERSVKAMEGIANATADAGQGAQQASMAMYNVSQAIGVGKMTSIDWKSLENANIATQKLKSTFLEMAALSGRIEKQTDGSGLVSYMLTTDEDGKKLKESIKLTTANFREYLSKGWLDKETMLRAFEVYSGQVDENTLRSWGITDAETIKKFMRIGQEALEAAQQVRTFSKMMDALKESAQSGWAKSFEYIFGNMEQGTNLWTEINEQLDGILSKSAESRNNILKIWAGADQNVDKENEQIAEKREAILGLQKQYDELAKKKKPSQADKEEMERIKKEISAYQKEIEQLELLIKDKTTLPKSTILDEKGRSGRDILIDSLLGEKNEAGERVGGLINLLKDLGSAISGAFEAVFGKFDAQRLFNLTQRFSNAIKGISNWFGKITDKGSRLSKIQKIIRGILGPIKMVFNILKMLWSLVKKIATPVIDFFLDAFSGVSEFFENLGNLNFVEIIQHIGDGLKTAWENIKKFFSPQQLMDDKGNLTGETEIPFIKWLKTIWSGLKNMVKKWATDNGLGQAWETLSNWWQTIKETLREGRVKLETIWNGVKDWFVKSGIAQFFTNIWNWITGFFKTPRQKFKDAIEQAFGDEDEDPTTMTIEAVKKKLYNLGLWKDEFEGMSVQDALSAPELDTTTGEALDIDKTPIGKFFESIQTGISEKWEAFTGWITSEDNPIKVFFENVWEWIKGIFTVPEGAPEGTNAPIVQFFLDLGSHVESAYKSFVKWWEGSGIPQFFKKIWSDVTGWFKPQLAGVYYGSNGREEVYTDSPIVAFFKNLWIGISNAYESLKKWWNEDSGIPQFFASIWETVNDWFTNPKEGEKTGFQKFLEDVGNGISIAWEAIQKLPWTEIRQFFTNIWDFIIGLFDGGESEVEAGAATGSSKRSGVIAAANNITGLYSDVSDNLIKKAGNEDPKKTNKALEIFKSIITTITDFFTVIIDKVKEWKITKEVSDFIENLGDFLGGILGAIGQFFGSIGRILGFLTTGKYDEDALWWKDTLTALLPILIGVITYLFEYRRIKNLSNISGTFGQSWGLQFLEICAGLMLAAGAIALLTTVDQDRLLGATGIVAAIGVVIGGILAAVAYIKNMATPAIAQTPLERILTTLIGKASIVGSLYIIIQALPGIIGAIKEAKAAGADNIGEDILKIGEGLSILFGSIALIMGIVQTITGGIGLSPAAALKTALSIGAILAVVSAIFTVIGGLPALIGLAVSDKETDEEKMREGVEAKIQMIKNASQIMTELGAAIGGFFGAVIGAFSAKKNVQETIGDMEAAKAASEIASQIDPDDLDSLSYVMSMLSAIQDSLPDYNGLLDKWINGDKLKKLGDQLPALGVGLATFASNVTGFTGDEMDKIQESVKLISWFSNAISTISDIALADTGTWEDHLRLNKDVFGYYKQAAEELSKAVAEGLRTGESWEGVQGKAEFNPLEFNARPIIDAIVNALKLGKTSIAYAVHEMVQAGLDMVNDPQDPSSPGDLKVKQTVIDKYAELFGQYSTSSGTTFNVNDMFRDILGDDSEFNTLLETFDTKMEQFSGKWANAANAFDIGDLFTITDPDDPDKKTDIVSVIQAEVGKLQEAVDELPEFRIKITPVLDFDHLTADNISTQLNGGNVRVSGLSMDATKLQVSFEGLSKELGMDEIRAKLDTLTSAVTTSVTLNTSAVNALGSHMDGIASEVARLKLYLDTGALVGGIIGDIDRELYNREQGAKRYGTVTMMKQ